MKSHVRVAQGLLITDGAVLLCYGVVSMLFVPGGLNESYLSSGRLLYGVLPTILGLGSLICAVWIGLITSKSAAPA